MSVPRESMENEKIRELRTLGALIFNMEHGSTSNGPFMPTENINKENSNSNRFSSFLDFLLLVFYENTLMTALHPTYYKYLVP